MQLILDLKDDTKLALVLEAIRRLVSSDGVPLTLRSPDRGVIFDPTDDDFEAQVAALIEEAIEEKATNSLPGKEQIEEAWQEMSAEISQRAKAQGIETDEDVDRLIREYRQEKKARTAA
jgi:hypothetical protein